MDTKGRVEGIASAWITSARETLRVMTCIVLASAVTACGGGGGGGGDGGGGNPPPAPTGQVAAMVVDQFQTPISGATISATSGTTTRTATTVAAGTATVTQVPTGSVSVTATAAGFIDGAEQSVTVNANAATDVTFTLVRIASATGGVLTARPVGPLSPDGSSYTFRIRVVVVDQDADDVEGLAGTAFTLEDCFKVVETPERPNCVRHDSFVFDADYTVTAGPANFTQRAPENDPPLPYAAALLLDSSGSIGGAQGSDPTDARIFASKVFLGGLGTGDLAMLSAFADDNPNPGGSASLLPQVPVTIYPCDPNCQASPFTFTNDGDSLFASLDSLAGLESGGTPLYDSLSFMISTVAAAAPATPSNLRRAVVLFSDGDDIYCAGNGGFQNCVDERQAVIDLSRQTPNVDIFTIGLTNGVNSLALAELADGGNGAYMFAENTEQLIPIYGSLGRLLSGSLVTYEMEWTITAEPGVLVPDLAAVLGRLHVNTGTAEFDLPFVAQIFEPSP